MTMSAASGGPSRPPKAAENVAAQLRAQIVQGALPPGSALPPEAALLHRFGVSRPTLREAFRILESESLIRVRRGSRGGAEVITPDGAATRSLGMLLQLTRTTVADIFEARMALEPLCAGMLARSRTDEDLQRLRVAVEELRDAIESDDDATRWSLLSSKFHELMIKSAGNNTLAVQAAVLQDIVRIHISSMVAGRNTETTIDDFRRIVRSYSKLIELVEARDSASAEAHWRSHMRVAAKNLIEDVGPNAVVELFA